MRLPTRLLRRKPDSHKGDFGHIFILAGSPEFSGAGVMASAAAMRAGAGLVTLGIPRGINSAVIKIKPLEIMTLPLAQTKLGRISFSAFSRIKSFVKNTDVLAIGPGLGREESTQKLVRRLVKETNKPMVIDADGLNALVGHLDLLRCTSCDVRPAILTPHPAEMSRLLGISVNQIQASKASRVNIAKKFAKDYKVTVVLKGYETVVADYKGNFYMNKTGNPGMSTAGCGDVLAGIIAAFIGQGLDIFSSAKYGVYLHGLAGDLAEKDKTQISLIATDIIDKIPVAVKSSLRRRSSVGRAIVL